MTQKIVWGLNGLSEIQKFNFDPSLKRLQLTKGEGFTYFHHPPWARLPCAAGLEPGGQVTSRGMKVSVPSGAATQEKDYVELEMNWIWALIFGHKYAEQSTGPSASPGVILWEEWPLHPLSTRDHNWKGLVWAKSKDFWPTTACLPVASR